MSILLALTLTLTPVAPGVLELSPLAEGAEIFAQGDDCSVTVKGARILGDGGCSVSIAVVSAEGLVSRAKGKLPSERFAEDLPAAPSQAKVAPRARPQAPASSQPTTPPTASPTPTPPSSQPTGRSTMWSAGTSVHLSRDIGPFGFISAGLSVQAIWAERLSITAQLERGTGRSETSLLANEDAVEQSIFLALIGLNYKHPISGGAFAYTGAQFGAGRIAADGITDERHSISESVQPITVARPSAGMGWRAGPISLSVGWQGTLAQGQYFSADAYGDTQGTKPPQNEGLLAQGLELQLGVTF